MCLDSKIVESLFVDDEFFSHVSSYKKINSGRYPKTDQWCDEEYFNLAFALAGFSPEDISVLVKGNTLWVSTEKIVSENKKEETGFIHRVGLVLQPVDPVTPGSVIAGGPAEQHYRPAARQHRPIGSRPDRKRVGGQPKPVICVEGRGQHLPLGENPRLG